MLKFVDYCNYVVVSMLVLFVLFLGVGVVLLSVCLLLQYVFIVLGIMLLIWIGLFVLLGFLGYDEELFGVQSLISILMVFDGMKVVIVKFEFVNGYVIVMIVMIGVGKFMFGFYGLYIYQVGKCEFNLVVFIGGVFGNFLFVGGYYYVLGYIGIFVSGDLVLLQVCGDGLVMLVIIIDVFIMDDLLSGVKIVIIIYVGVDNFVNILLECYVQVNGILGFDEMMLIIGDVGKWVVCGVIGFGQFVCLQVGCLN